MMQDVAVARVAHAIARDPKANEFIAVDFYLAAVIEISVCFD